MYCESIKYLFFGMCLVVFFGGLGIGLFELCVDGMIYEWIIEN